MAADYTPRQGQFLAFIYYYTKIHRIPPAETDMQRFFRISPPAVHEMVKTLERQGFITREPGRPGRFVFFCLKTSCRIWNNGGERSAYRLVTPERRTPSLPRPTLALFQISQDAI